VTTESSTPAPAPAADPGTAAEQTGGTQQANAPQQTETPSNPDTVTLTRAEYEALNTNANRFKGDRPLVEAALKAGIQKPEDFDPILQSHQMMQSFQQHGKDPNEILNMLNGQSPQQQEQPQHNGGLSAEQIEQLVGKTVQSSLTSYQSQQQHETEWSSMENALFSKVDELAGDNEVSKSGVEALVSKFANEMLEQYPHDHPLAGKYKPLSQGQIDGAIRKAQETLDALVGSRMSGGQVAQTPTQGAGLQSNTGGDGIAGRNQNPVWNQSPEEQVQLAQRLMDQAAEQNQSQSAGGFSIAGLNGT